MLDGGGREFRTVASDGELSSFIAAGKQERMVERSLLQSRCGRARATLLGLAGLLAVLVTLRAALPSPCKSGREANELPASSTMELLEVNVDVPAERRRAADARAEAIVSLLNEKPHSEAGLLVRKAMEMAGNETLARRRALRADGNAEFNEILRKAAGECFVASMVPDEHKDSYLTVDVRSSKISLAASNGKYEQWRIFTAGADDVYSITALNVPPAGAFLNHGQGPLHVLMGDSGQDQSWKIRPVPDQAGQYTIEAVMPGGQGRVLLSHDKAGLVSLERINGASMPRQRWQIPCVEQSPGRKKQRQATCAFNVIYTMQYLARSGLLIQAAAKTCPNSKGLLSKVCALNALAASASLANVALSLSNAASSCAETTNVHALCASGVEALIVSLSTLGAGGLVTAVGCKPGLTVADLGLPPGATPANPGGPSLLGGRRLFLGGGKINFMAQCVLDFTQVAWSLGSIGIAISAAARDSCPPSGTGLLHELTQSACAMDVGAVLYAFGRIAVFLALAVIHCTNELNLQALCAAGISALVAAAAALVVTGNAFFIACEKGIPFVKGGGLVPEIVGASAEAGATRRLAAKTFSDAMKGKDIHRLVESYGYNISDPLRLPAFDNVNSALKALESFDELQAERVGVGRASLTNRFESPEKMWQQLGFNTSKLPEAPKPGHESERFVRLMEPVLSKEELDKVAAAAAPEASQKWLQPLTKSMCA